MRLSLYIAILGAAVVLNSCSQSSESGAGGQPLAGNNPLGDIVTQNSDSEARECLATSKPAQMFGTWQKVVFTSAGVVTYVINLGNSFIELTKVCNVNGQVVTASARAYASFIGGSNPYYIVTQNARDSKGIPGTSEFCTASLNAKTLNLDYFGGCLNLDVLGSAKVYFMPTNNLAF